MYFFLAKYNNTIDSINKKKNNRVIEILLNEKESKVSLLKTESDINKIKSKLNQGRPLYIWGAGKGGVDLLEHLKFHGIEGDNIEGFIDKDVNKWGVKIHNISVFNPDDVLNNIAVKPFIIISSTFSNDIEKSLSSIGYQIYSDYMTRMVNIPLLLFK